MTVIKKKKTPMQELTKGYEKFIKGKEPKNNSKELFEKVIKKITEAKSLHGSK